MGIIMRTKATYLCVLAISLLLGAVEEFSGQSVFGPTVRVSTVEHWYGETVNSIRQIDFRNLWYYVKFGTRGHSFQLRNGEFKRESDFGGDEISLEHVYYFRLDKSEQERALVQIQCDSHGGSSGQAAVLQVFEVELEQLVMTQQLEYDLQARGTGTEFNPKTGVLTVRARTNDGSAHCCPKSVDIVTLRWSGKAFEERSHRTIPVEGR
jgi:hypothetical protein